MGRSDSSQRDFRRAADDLDRAVLRAGILHSRIAPRRSRLTEDSDLLGVMTEVLGWLENAEDGLRSGASPVAELKAAKDCLEQGSPVSATALVTFLAHTASSCAESAQLSPPTLVVDGPDTLMSLSELRVLWIAAPHLTRNAIIHGIESPDVRKKRGQNDDRNHPRVYADSPGASAV